MREQGMPEIRSIGTVGVIGCGRMGQPIAGHLIDGGHDVIVLDPAAAAVEPLVARGVRSAATPADVVIVIVVDDDQTRAVVSGQDGLLSTARPGSIIVICPSLSPRTCQELAVEVKKAGVRVVTPPWSVAIAERRTATSRSCAVGRRTRSLRSHRSSRRSRPTSSTSVLSAPVKWARPPTT